MNEPSRRSEGLVSLLVFSKDAKPHPGGIAEYLHGMCEHLGRSGIQTVLATPVRAGPGDEPRWHNVHRLPSPYGTPFDAFEFAPTGGLFHSLRQTIQARAWARHWAGQLVRAHSPQVAVMGVWSGLTECWAAACRRLRLPVAYIAYGWEVSWRGCGLRHRLLFRGRRRAFTRAQIVFAISQATADAVARLGVSRSRIALARPGIDLARYRPVPHDRCEEVARAMHIEGKRIVLSVARLVARKGIATMLRALPDVLREVPDCVYVIAGSGREEGALRARTADMGLGAHVVFAGEVSDDQKRALYQLCDVFVLPCRDLPDGDMEGFGIVFLEAAAYGKPVVAGRAGGVADAVEDGATGFLVDPESPGDFAASVTRLLRERDIAARLGRRGRSRVETMTWETSAATVREVLNRLAAARPAQ